MVDTTEKKDNKNIFDIVGKLSDTLIYEQTTGKDIVEAQCRRLKQDQKEKCQNAYNDFYAYRYAIESYSTFDANMIGNMLAILISLIEGKNFVFKLTEYNYNDTYIGEYDAIGVRKTKKIQMIIDEEDFPYWRPSTPDFEGVWYFPKELKEKYGEKANFNSHFIILNMQPGYKDYSQTITFYELYKDKLNQLVDFGKFDYAKGLIDAIVQFRFENNLDVFREEDLMAFLNVCLDKAKNNYLSICFETLKDKMLARIVSGNN